MRQIVLVWIFHTVLLIGEDTPLAIFYNSLNQDLILSMEIDFLQNQFGNTFYSSGLLYIIGNRKYVYDSSLIIVIVEDSLITTINNQTRQVVYSSIEKDYVTILDILSGNFNNIEFLNKTGTHLDHFIVPNLGYSGSFQFDKNSDLLRSLKLFIDEDQSIMIQVNAVDYIEKYDMSDIKNKKFEVIDLRE